MKLSVISIPGKGCMIQRAVGERGDTKLDGVCLTFTDAELSMNSGEELRLLFTARLENAFRVLNDMPLREIS